MQHSTHTHTHTALTYTLTVDSSKGRAGLYQQNSGVPLISENQVSETITIPRPGSENEICPQTYTFALRVSEHNVCILVITFCKMATISVLCSVHGMKLASICHVQADFTETAPIPVLLTVADSPNPLALEPDPVSERLGGPLHPVLMRYVRGDEPAPLSLQHEVCVCMHIILHNIHAHAHMHA